MTLPLTFSFSLPAWTADWRAHEGEAILPDDASRVELAIALSARNLSEGTGGPFGAAVIETVTGRIVAIGVNLVPSQRCSVLHAEMVAIMLAQRELGRYDLSAGGREKYDLVASTAPCAMCFGATPWAGFARLLYGAGSADAVAVGFDEGAKPHHWQDALRARGIDVVGPLLREKAAAVLHEYVRTGNATYNGATANQSSEELAQPPY